MKMIAWILWRIFCTANIRQKMFAVNFFDCKMDGGVLWQKIKRKEEIAVIEINEQFMKQKLYEFRGCKVLLDADLAEVYGYDLRLLISR